MDFENFRTTAPAYYNNDYITYVCISSPNLDKLKRNLELIMPYVDRALIVIGRRDEEAENFLAPQKNVQVVYRKWTDSFRDQYQVGLDNVSGGWMLWLDDDEVPSSEMLQSLRPIIAQSQGAARFDTVAFRCCDLNEDGQPSTPSNYYREMLVAWNPNLRFHIHLHQGMVGKRGGVRCDAVYFHPKDPSGGLRGACRNFFIGGVWADTKESFEYWYERTGQDPRINPGTPLSPLPNHPAYPLQDGFKIDAWHEMKAILAKEHPEVEYYGELDKLIQTGKICPELKAWAIAHNRENDKRPHVGEMHAFDLYIKNYCENSGRK